MKFSKTDPDAEGHVRYLAPFAIVALNAWLKEAKIDAGCLFRRVLHNGTVGQKPLTDHEVARVFKRLAGRVDAGGLGVAGIAGHSTRIGAAHENYVTSTELLTGGGRVIVNQSDHPSIHRFRN